MYNIENARERGECTAFTFRKQKEIIKKTYKEFAYEVKCLGEWKEENVPQYCMSNISDFIRQGELNLKKGGQRFDTVVLDETDVATIVFTSGTTGKSKGVVLTHKNLCADIVHSCESFIIYGGVVAFLPFHHIFGMIVGIMMVYHYGYPIHINHSLKYMMKDLQQFKPQTLMLVPLYVESFYKQIFAEAQKQGKETKLRNAGKLAETLWNIRIDVRKRMFGEILQKFGGNLEYIICGGAALDPFYVKEFHKLGIEIYNGYGITECSSVISVNRNKSNRIGSVGQVIPGCSMKIDKDGEILVKGENVLKEYYKDEQSTKESFVDGWYRTGDLGYLDKDGFLFVNGRKKNLIILSNGENVSPEGIEQELVKAGQIEEIVIRGEENHLTAEIFPNQDMEVETVKKDIQLLIDRWNKNQPAYRQINEIKWRENEFEKTTSRKIKRN